MCVAQSLQIVKGMVINMANNRYELNKELAQMLKGGVIMDVTTPEQARIAQEAGACAVMALERIPADIRAAGGVSRMSDPKMIKGIQEAVSIPVMAKCRIGHFVEAQLLEAIEIDYIDESEVLSPADDKYHIDKMIQRLIFYFNNIFFVPFFYCLQNHFPTDKAKQNKCDPVINTCNILLELNSKNPSHKRH